MANNYHHVWTNNIVPLIEDAFDRDNPLPFAKQRSLLRKALAFQLAEHGMTDSDVAKSWQHASWRHHIKLTRETVSGLAACFGGLKPLLLQIAVRHLQGEGQIDDVHYDYAEAALWHWDQCADGRGNSHQYGMSINWGHEMWSFCWEWLTDNLCIDERAFDDTDTDTDEDVPSAETKAGNIDASIRSALDNLLGAAGLPDVTRITGLEQELQVMRKDWDASIEVCERLKDELSRVSTLQPSTVSGDGTIPDGQVVIKKASEVFGIEGAEASMFDIDVPFGEWAGRHPHIPAMDEDYVFDVKTLVPMLLAINSGSIPWLKGHTGTGKTTLVEQVYSRLNLPLFRLNLDSDITRGELVGREVLRTNEDGNTVSEFIEGIIPMAMQQPCGLLLDEVDASRPDLGFVLQRLTEGKGFMLLEDGGRTIMPHAHFRMFATANTNGRGDETGLYSGTRALGTAFVNRFKPYIEVDYMASDEERALLLEKVPALEPDDASSIAAYADEHRIAFKQADVTLACSPRDTLAFASAAVEYKRCFGADSAWLHMAFEHSILNAADSDDRQVLDGLANRVFKGGNEDA